MSVVSEFQVTGMTCGHCVSSVSEEISQLVGVESVDIDLVPQGISRVHVTADRALTANEVGPAVAEAGYELQTSA